MDRHTKLEQLRKQFALEGIDGFLVPHTDAFGSEYLPASDERLVWITGFTGSAGHAVLLMDKAVVMTDSRYAIQIKQQVDDALFEIADSITLPIGDWLVANAGEGAVIGYDPRLHNKKQIDGIESRVKDKNITLKPILKNPIDVIWTDRPIPPVGIVEMFPDKIAGKTSLEKRTDISAALREERVSAAIITQADSICWLLNIRGDDIPCNPLVLSYLILHSDDGRVDWFVNSDKVPDSVLEALGSDIKQHPLEDFETVVKSLSGAVQFDEGHSPVWVYNLLAAAGIESVSVPKDPCVTRKAIKTIPEQKSMRQAHLRDGVALTKFLFWMETQDLDDGHVSEISVAEKLEELRRGHESYRGKSFDTIAGWNENGAIVHYHASAETSKTIQGNGLLLLDSGGQYEYGTTDVTRTIVVGNISNEMKDRFTRVLKGHIALSSARFEDETDGKTLDIRARQFLKEVGLDFGHGTGHGVGCFLCVHEEAAPISPRGDKPMKAGMVTSNEPGYYHEGAYGIRHENLMLCQEDDNGLYYFEPLTLVPFDRRGIDWSLMTEDETKWLDDYHRHVRDSLSPFLDDIEAQWLENFLFPKEKQEPTEEEEILNWTAYD